MFCQSFCDLAPAGIVRTDKSHLLMGHKGPAFRMGWTAHGSSLCALSAWHRRRKGMVRQRSCAASETGLVLIFETDPGRHCAVPIIIIRFIAEKLVYFMLWTEHRWMDCGLVRHFAAPFHHGQIFFAQEK